MVIWKLKDLLVSIGIETVMIAFTALFKKNGLVTVLPTLDGVNDFVCVVIICNLYRFGASVDDILKDINDYRMSDLPTELSDQIQNAYDAIACGTTRRKSLILRSSQNLSALGTGLNRSSGTIRSSEPDLMLPIANSVFNST
ncbi:hypothetical protein HDU76_009019 [Blyttiomyces sp. JEL0837]|nr:hypothetical protein HDU76_009019 [Blyttiomyces sp. JEL0837]